jgi:hypothetical protein
VIASKQHYIIGTKDKNARRVNVFPLPLFAFGFFPIKFFEAPHKKPTFQDPHSLFSFGASN